jgi:hypothetical protein
MNTLTIHAHLLRTAWAAGLLLASAGTHAATFSSSATPPVRNEADIQHTGERKGAEKVAWGTELAGLAKGLTFTTGAAPVVLKALTCQVNQKMEPIKTYRVRVSTVSVTNLTEVYHEDIKQLTRVEQNDFITWALETPVLLKPQTTYGVDVGMLDSDKTWNVGGLLYLFYTDPVPGMTRYDSGDIKIGGGLGNNTMRVQSGSYICHLDLAPAESATCRVLSDGTLVLDKKQLLPEATALVLGNATLAVQIPAASVGTLTLMGDARINLGENTTLAFADSSAIIWTGNGGGTLNILGTFVNGKSLRFGSNNKGLTSDQLALISAKGLKNFALNDKGYLTAVEQ